MSGRVMENGERKMRRRLSEEVGGFTVRFDSDRLVLIGWTDRESFVKTIRALARLLEEDET